MSISVETQNVFIMDSGPFLDVIPIILSYLDLKSLISLSETCHFWKERIYNDLKLWPKSIELPYIGHMHCPYYSRHDPETIIKAKLWSMVLPPEDPNALEKVLEKMSSSQQSIDRFQLVEHVNFKNFLHTDESLRLTGLLFPSIEDIHFEGNRFTLSGVRHIALSCRKVKHIEFYQCPNIDMSSALGLFNNEDHKNNLERIFIHGSCFSISSNQLKINDILSFMDLCQRCGLYFNLLKNAKQMLCLYHPGTYDGYGHSCSSFSCCGSNTPRYSSTLGCQYTHHQNRPDQSFRRMRTYELLDGHPEYMFQIYNQDLFTLTFTDRRDLNQCYHLWNNIQ